MSVSLEHRKKAYNLLKGKGLEIGAFNEPATIPTHCTIEYCDALSREEAAQYFPELNVNTLVKVEYICDLDKKGLSLFESEHFDFVIFNHVIEHVANPIKVIEEIFRITKQGGYVIISAPDKNFTFDKPRNLTSFEHLKTEYDNNITESTDDHYLDFLGAVNFRIPLLEKKQMQFHIDNARARREHVHVWDSNSFSDFIVKTLELLKLKATCEFVSVAKDNEIEYFSLWKKSNT